MTTPIPIFRSDQPRDRFTPLSAQARRLYPESEYLQAEWLRAVAVVRSTTNGWRLDRSVPRVPR